MLVAGIDPGKKGALCLMANRNVITLEKLPFGGDGWLREAEFVETLLAWGNPDLVVLEHVHATPNDNKKGAFSFGDTFGSLRSLVRHACPGKLRLAPPSTWKPRMLGSGTAKREVCEYVKELYPDARLVRPRCRVPDDNLAEALLLALYGFDFMS